MTGRLLAPRIRPDRAADVATRASLIGNQRHRATRARRVRRSVRLAARGLAIALVAGAIVMAGRVALDWIHHTPALAVAAVEVEGLSRVSEETVLQAAGVTPGTSLLAVDPRAVAARVEALPGVKQARVIRGLPRRVTVRVEEREPYALVNAEGLVWIDAEGYLVGPERRPGAPGLPILSGIARNGVGGGRAPSSRIVAGLALVRAVQRAGGQMAGRISEIDLAPDDGPVLYTTDGAEVRVGDTDWSERLTRLDGVLADLERRGERVSSVDLRFRDLVVLKPRAIARERR